MRGAADSGGEDALVSEEESEGRHGSGSRRFCTGFSSSDDDNSRGCAPGSGICAGKY